MLRACRLALKPGGRIAYYNIFISEELPEAERHRAGQDAPAGTYTRAGQKALLRAAGFARISEQDVTDEYLRVARALYEANERHAAGIRRAQGAQAFREAQEGRRRTLERIEQGIAKRALLVAERPSPRRPSRPPRPAR